MTATPDLKHPVFVHFYRAVVGHMDVWRQRMDATTNWAAATTAGMVTFTFGAVDSPHVVLLLALLFNGVFLLMESRRYQIFDLWRRRFRLMNRFVIAPVLVGEAEIDESLQREALGRLAEDLGRMLPHLPLGQAAGYRLRRNYIYLFAVGILGWFMKLELHPYPAEDLPELIARAGIGAVPGTVVTGTVGLAALIVVGLALRAPSEQMLNWAEVPSPLQRWVTWSQDWSRGLFRPRSPEDDEG